MMSACKVECDVYAAEEDDHLAVRCVAHVTCSVDLGVSVKAELLQALSKDQLEIYNSHHTNFSPQCNLVDIVWLSIHLLSYLGSLKNKAFFIESGMLTC